MADEIILKIGEVDMSEYCDRNNLSISKNAVWKDGGFKAMDGTPAKKLLGVKYSISASFTDIPNSVKNALDGACSAESVNITFGTVTAAFSHPDTTYNLSYVTSLNEKMWDISFSSVCDIIPGGL